MSKYDLGLDLDSKNSASIIINMIKPKSKVLEFGSANGRMTRYLSEKIGCQVDIVEIDYEAGLDASKYSNKSLIGEELGDIEKYKWLDELKDEQYDFIIFADVLEHLHCPNEALKVCNRILKEDGSILLSVPNIAHNSVLIDLINDEFKYNQTGLLDNTHITFFTYKSFIRMIYECGYQPVKEEAAYCKVGANEIDNNYNFISKEFAKELRMREKGNIYQYVFEIKKIDFIATKSPIKAVNLDINSEYEFMCYIKEKNSTEYSESKVIRKFINPTHNIIQLDFDGFDDIKALRIDPIDTNCIIDIKRIYTIIDEEERNIDILNTNGINIIDSIYMFSTNDPQIYLNLEDINMKHLYYECVFIDFDSDSIDKYTSILEKLITKQNMILVEKEIEEKEIVEKEKEKGEKEKKKVEKEKEIVEKEKEVVEKEKVKIEEYLANTLEHVNKLEKICKDLTLKGRIKRILKKIGIKKNSSLYLVIKNPSLIVKAILIIRKSGIKGLKDKIEGKKFTSSANSDYLNQQIEIEKQLSVEKVQNQIEKLENKPMFSIIMPVYNVGKQWIEKAIESINNQTYPYWELCIVDDCSTNPETIDYIECIKNEKIKVKRLQENSGISNATNNAKQMAIGEYLILMDNDDEMRKEALYQVAEAINNHNPDVLYSDEDKISLNGERKFPFMKPDWSRDLLYSQMYICHLLVIKKEIFDKVGGFRDKFNGAQDYDLMLRISELTDNIYHIPRVLYSWREIPSSTAMNPNSKPYAHVAGLEALDEHLKRKYGSEAYSQETDILFVYDARFNLKQEEVMVSIIIPTKDKLELLKPCIESILEKTKYANYEILILNNNSSEDQTYEWFRKVEKDYSNIRVIDAFYEFNWSKLNNHGINEANGDVYVFLNNDTTIISPDWLERLSENAMREDVGTVGALLLYEDGTIQHAGVVLGMGGWADHVFKGMHPVHFGSPYVSPVINRNVLACTGACLAISKNTIDKIGAFDENFIICGSDVEISLRARKHGLNNLYNARVKLYHLESKSRDSYIPEIDFEMSKIHYQEYLDNGDPYYNSQLDLYSTSPRIKG
ncbi:glycosyltransferase [Clostridium saccharoperbutylacetonicum]